MDKSELPEKITALITAAEAGDASAQFDLAVMYDEGEGLEQNDQEALVWYRKAAEQGHPAAQFNLALMYSSGQGVDKNEQEALVWYRKAAELGLAQAQFNLALMYENGQCVEQSNQEAVIWYRRAAEQQHAKSQFNLALLYDKGHGVEQNSQEALFWYSRAAEQQHTKAQFNLALMYRKGLGVKQSDQEAFVWYRKAAEQGDAPAQNNLGLMYDNGEGVEQSNKEALVWYRKAAEQGFAPAQFNLALMYVNAQGVEQNNQEAFVWYCKAAEQGYASAQFNLALMYRYGKGVEQSDKEAASWFRKAALSSEPDLHFKAIEYQDHAERRIISPKITDIRSLILQSLKVNIEKSPTMTHYTSLLAGESLLLKGSPFRLGHINSLNDPSEGKLLWRYLGHSHIEGNPVFIGCFLPDDDSLNMWRFYSKNHHKDDACGCAITFDTNKFVAFSLLEEPHEYKQETKNNLAFINTGKLPQESAAFYQVIYLDDSMNIHGNDDKDTIIESLAELKNEVAIFLGDTLTDEKLKQLARLLGPLPYLFKDADYEAEQEHRIIISHLKYGAKEIQSLEPTLENGIHQTAPKLYLELHRENHLAPVKHVTLNNRSEM